MFYYIRLPFTEFQEYFCDGMMTSHFNKYVAEDDYIEIKYRYGKYKMGKSTIYWRLSDCFGYDETDLDFHKIYKLRYTGSSPFALWWSGISEEAETCPSDEEDEKGEYFDKELMV